MSHADAGVLTADLATQADLLDRGEISAVQLVEWQLAAVEASQPVINSYLQVDRAAALAAAAQSDARRAQGAARALEGLAIAVKDNIDVAGMRTSAGMAVLRDSPPAQADNPAVAGLRAAGAIILGKLNMHEAALGADNDNPHFGACHNPHRPGFTPGGSSGGSGAAVAAGLCGAALGTDTMGSVRIPASYCGVFGLKPTWGAVSTRGTVPLCRRLDHIGPLARSARDLGVLLKAMAGFDPDCAQSRSIAFSASRPGPLRIGVVDVGDTVEIDADVQRAFEAGLQGMLQLGHRRVSLPPPAFPSGQARRAGLLMCEAELLVEHTGAWRDRRDGFSPLLAKLMGWAEARSAAELAAAEQLVDQAQVQLQQWLRDCDVVLMPTTPQRAFAFGSPVPANQADLTAYANMAGNPALSVPLPVDADELPVGMQLIGHRGDDLQLVALADAFQNTLRWKAELPAAATAWWPA